MYLLLSFEIFILWPFCWRVLSDCAIMELYSLHLIFTFYLNRDFSLSYFDKDDSSGSMRPVLTHLLTNKTISKFRAWHKPLAARARRARSFKILRALTKFLTCPITFPLAISHWQSSGQYSSGFMLVNYTGCKTRVRAPCGHVWIVTGKSCKTRNLT